MPVSRTLHGQSLRRKKGTCKISNRDVHGIYNEVPRDRTPTDRGEGHGCWCFRCQFSACAKICWHEYLLSHHHALAFKSAKRQVSHFARWIPRNLIDSTITQHTILTDVEMNAFSSKVDRREGRKLRISVGLRILVPEGYSLLIFAREVKFQVEAGFLNSAAQQLGIGQLFTLDGMHCICYIWFTASVVFVLIVFVT